MKHKLTLSLLLVGSVTINATSMKNNSQIVLTDLPSSSVNSFSEMISGTKVYGRLRSNTFSYKWEDETGSQDDHTLTGLGGSLLFKTPKLNNFDFTAGLYYTRAIFWDVNNVSSLKSGKDVVNRSDYASKGTKSLGVLGQAYVRYTGLEKSELKVGRQIVESFYTKSNDTKMIPNTFDGVVFNTKLLDKTSVKVAYLDKQKLRDHDSSHSVLYYDGWSQNDDSAMHKWLTTDVDSGLFIVEAKNSSVKNLKLQSSYYSVDDLVSQAMVEANYKIPFNGFSVTPGIRYIQQYDDGAGAIGGAYLNGSDSTINNVDSDMIAARVVANYDVYRFNAGYTKIADKADLITPWRGFPTGGYTRSMARYNWTANTESYRLELQINRNKTGIYNDMYVQTSILHIDADESKGKYDKNYYYLGLMQNLEDLPQLQWRLRFGYTDSEKPSGSNLDSRFELNYFF